MVTKDSKSGKVLNADLRLLVYREGAAGTHRLKGERWTVGRAEDCDITIDDPTVSRRHLILERTGNLIRFRDLGGTNALVLDGRRTGAPWCSGRRA
jgi:pSer/pThr/pTyr-binding forkhead associated (FHA) protein